ncbi:FAD dependent oxidoreductase [Gluconacetobacter sacchari DSM 12717]|uniref:NAD(P)/FAD-dependent oxidoreductase n=2 Tax=Gluconacetobacter sacchari TaxID=92759 RepID=A0A7W4IH32_9PROT|nr:NAD(P)/FAD-dependent oxidoreductase [Gluconacetobacter sacchari]MBB2162785.1 NAD(P)/FAD-dependent oxidoreductase [Gluconacetobacter sacchari]GBQ27408.1 FAD dependent oxidoreductase [Gluconacetobacter sacchari DSM 12717]
MSYDYDIAIIGSGISGSMLGSILSRHGANVVILDAGTHPRFAVGESMIPESGVLLTLLSEAFDIPELRYPANIDLLNKHVGSSSAGIKLSFSFAWNDLDRQHNPRDLVSTPVLAPEAHLFRQDVDAYYVALAARLGAIIRQQVRITSIHPDDDGVTLNLERGKDLRVRYVVDASGFRSPLASQMRMREGAPEMQTRTRSIFTHMVGVRTYEEAIADLKTSRSPTHIGQSTLHHIFDQGWLWIIPFDNHPHSTNPLCSVGLQFQIDQHGPAGDPEQEFQRFLERHPSVQLHFEGAARVREWTVAPRINYNSRVTISDRYCLLGHAAGFVDPLFSRGLANTFESILRVAPKILRSLRDNKWHSDDFFSYDRYSRSVVAINDRLVANSYSAFRSFPLWNAWFRVWLSGSYIGVLRLRRILADFRSHGDLDALEQAFDNATYPGHLSIESRQFETLFEKAATAMEAKEAGEINESEAIARLQYLFVEIGAGLPINFADFNNRFVSRPDDKFANALLNWANSAPFGLASKLARPGAGHFEYLDTYRYGDRLMQIRHADEALEQLPTPGKKTTAL